MVKMKTKNLYLSMLAMVSMLFATSCSQDDAINDPSAGNLVDATFTVSTDVAIGTRAVGDGLTVNKVACAVYDAAGKEMKNLYKIEDVTERTATYSVRLAKGQSYRVAFFAYYENTDGKAAYDVLDLKNIKFNSGMLSNDESRDAFTAYVDVKAEDLTKNGSIKQTVYLKRPFAQLNLGIDKAELDDAANAGIVVAESQITVTDVYNAFSAYDNTIAKGAEPVSMKFAMHKVLGESLKVNEKEYTYLALNYLLVGDEKQEKSLTDVEFVWKTADEKTNNPTTKFLSIPVQRNFRTNIIGKLLTSPATFDIEVDQRFDGEYDNQDMLDKVLAEGGSFKLFSDMTISEPITIESDKTVDIDLNGNTLTIATENRVKGNLSISNGNVVVDVNGQGDLLPAFTAYNGVKVDLNNANINLDPNNALVVVANSEVAATINVNKTTITGASGSVTHGISMPFGAKDIKINITESTLTGEYALYLYATNSVVTIDDKSLVKDFWIMGGKVDIAYTGTKPEVKMDDLAAEVNFYSQNEYPLHAAIAKGGEITLTEDVVLTQPIALAADVEATLNLNGKTISGNFTDKDNEAVIYNNGTLTLTGGTIKNDAVNGAAVITNSGKLVLKGVDITGAPIGTEGYPSYAVYSSGELTIEEGTTISSDRGAISLQNGANVTINGGNFEVTNAVGSRTLTAHVIYAYGSSSKLTINGGDFAQNIANGGGTSVICPAGATIKVYGGNFYHEPVSDVQSGCFQNYMGYGAPVDVYGGTYNDNTVTKSGNLAEGYKAIESNGKFVVVPEAVDVVASSASEVSAAIAAGNTVMLTGDVTYETAITKDAEINLNGNTFEALNTLELKNNSDLTMIGGNYEVNGTYGHVDVRPSTVEGSVVVYKDVNFSFNKLGPTNGPSTNRLGSVVEVCATATGANTKIRFEHCTFDNAMVLFEGLSGTVGTFEAEFVNCTFNALTSSAPIYVQNYVKGTIKLTGCTFNLECTSSTASAVSVSSSSSTSVTINAENNTINAIAATPYTFDASKGETEVHNVKVNGTPADIMFISCYGNTTVNETGTTKTGIAQ